MHTFKACFRSVFLLASLLMLSLPVSNVEADAMIYRVSSTGQVRAGCGRTWLFTCDLQHALTIATVGDTIWVAQGTYKPTRGTDRIVSFVLKNGVAVYGGFQGNETVLEQRDPAAFVTVLSGDIGVVGEENDNSYHVVVGSGTDSSAVLDGFKITRGNAGLAWQGNPHFYGGGMLTFPGSPTLANIIFSNNQAESQGGGLYNSGSPTLTNVTFLANSANAGGGGMYNKIGSPTLVDVTFDDNSVVGSGAGLYNESGNPTLTNVVFSNNHSSSDTAGMSNYSGSPVLVDVTFLHNTADGMCGGMMTADDQPTLRNVTFQSNSAEMGGGICVIGGSPTLDNVTFSDNNSELNGGGMANMGEGLPTLTNVTFSGNHAAAGGAIHNQARPMFLRNSILWGNSAPQITNGGSPRASISDSIVEGGYSGGTNIITADPLLDSDAFGNNGGFTDTIPLLPGSAAIDAGNDQDCPRTDQRGVDRPQGLHCDLGAYETQIIVEPGMYDDLEPAWTYVGVWTLTKLNGPYNDTLHQSNIAGSYAEVVFQGTQVQLFYTQDLDYGLINVYLDGIKLDPIDASGVLTWQAAWMSPRVAAGVHRVRFVHVGAGTQIDIDAIRISEVSVVPAGTYDDTDPAWNYTGNWVTYTGSGPYNNTLHYTDTVGDSAELSFQGTQFTLTYTKANNRGLIEVYVDEVLVDTINAHASSTLWQRTWTSPTFASGSHTVRFVHAGGGTNIDVDAIAILP